MFSVETEEEAKKLLTLACATNWKGEFIAKEVTEEQTLENLQAFGERLEQMYELVRVQPVSNG